MGGHFIDCNDQFTQFSGYSRHEVCSFVIFDLVVADDLQDAFLSVCSLILQGVSEVPQESAEVRGLTKDQDGMGLSISLARGDAETINCLCVELTQVQQTESTGHSLSAH
jgi:PAS domain S-box-containing protein